LPQDAFDRAVRRSLRESPLPAPPDWLDAQIQSAARDQAQKIYTAAPKPRASTWWQAPWLKVALPPIAVATLLIAVWLPQTQVTEHAVYLPEAARMERAAPTAAAPVLADQTATPTSNTGAQQESGQASEGMAAAPAPLPVPAPASPPTAKPLPKAAPAQETKAVKPEQPERPRQAAPLAAPPAPTSRSAPAVESAAPQAAGARENASERVEATDLATPTPSGNKQLMTRAGEARTEAAAPSVVYSSTSRAAADARMQARAGTPVPAPAQHSELEAIRQLLRDGKREDAVKRLNALLERVPGLEVPEDLRPLLTKP
jgi:hypothetical protein